MVAHCLTNWMFSLLKGWLFLFFHFLFSLHYIVLPCWPELCVGLVSLPSAFRDSIYWSCIYITFINCFWREMSISHSTHALSVLYCATVIHTVLSILLYVLHMITCCVTLDPHVLLYLSDAGSLWECRQLSIEQLSINRSSTGQVSNHAACDVWPPFLQIYIYDVHINIAEWHSLQRCETVRLLCASLGLHHLVDAC